MNTVWIILCLSVIMYALDRVEKMGFQNTVFRILHSGENVAVDKKAFSLLKVQRLPHRGNLQLAAAHIAEFHCFMPMPRNNGFFQVHRMKGIGISIVQALNFFHPVAAYL